MLRVPLDLSAADTQRSFLRLRIPFVSRLRI